MPGADDDDGGEHGVRAGVECNHLGWESRWDYGSDKVEGHNPNIPDGNMEQCNPYYWTVPIPAASVMMMSMMNLIIHTN